MTRELVERLIEEEMPRSASRPATAFDHGRWADARALFTEMALADEFAGFLTIPAVRADAVSSRPAHERHAGTSRASRPTPAAGSRAAMAG